MTKKWTGWKEYHAAKRRRDRMVELQNAMLMWGLWLVLGLVFIGLGVLLRAVH